MAVKILGHTQRYPCCAQPKTKKLRPGTPQRRKCSTCNQKYDVSLIPSSLLPDVWIAVWTPVVRRKKPSYEAPSLAGP